MKGKMTMHLLLPTALLCLAALSLQAQDMGKGFRDQTTVVVDVVNPVTGKTWMDRNLGASRPATSSTDAEAYGDLYQWGRCADGHQERLSSGEIFKGSSTDQPGHGWFIEETDESVDWRTPKNDSLWQGVNGVNNPCPAGYRIPTQEEWLEEMKSWSTQDATGAFASPLRLSMSGSRVPYDGGPNFSVGKSGGYWSSTTDGGKTRYVGFEASGAYEGSIGRANALSVRCLKD